MPPPLLREASGAGGRPSRADLVALVYEQAWGLCVAYLAVGLIFEVLRRFGAPKAALVQEFLDGLPLFTIRQCGLLELYLRASALNQLTPFWNRVLLASITVGTIVLQATVLGLVLATAWGLLGKRRGRES
jgi:hypothetical protein